MHFSRMRTFRFIIHQGGDGGGVYTSPVHNPVHTAPEQVHAGIHPSAQVHAGITTLWTK